MTKIEYLISGALLLIIGLAFNLEASADELLMIHNPECQFCQNFLKEVEPGYAETDLGKELPLIIFDMAKDTKDPNFAWVNKAYQERRWNGVRATPTFIIWIGDRETGGERGRIEGYGSVEGYDSPSDWFYSKLQTAYDRAKMSDEAHEQYLDDLERQVREIERAIEEAEKEISRKERALSI